MMRDFVARAAREDPPAGRMAFVEAVQSLIGAEAEEVVEDEAHEASSNDVRVAVDAGSPRPRGADAA